MLIITNNDVIIRLPVEEFYECLTFTVDYRG